MLDAHEVDLVCIATPTVLHAPQTLKALAGARTSSARSHRDERGEAQAMLTPPRRRAAST
jgi:hypothetical protein